jgi:hypothetical protein
MPHLSVRQARELSHRHCYHQPHVNPPGKESSPGHIALVAEMHGYPALRVQGRSNGGDTGAATCTNSPGPGTYRPEDQQNSGPAFTIPQSDTVPTAHAATPGPGQYAALSINRGPAFTISTVGLTPAASDSAAQPSPGPGEYHLMHQQEEVATGPAFSMARAHKETQDADSALMTPGPGEYGKDSSAPVQGGPAFTMAGKYVSALCDMHLRSHVHWQTIPCAVGVQCTQLTGSHSQVARRAAP